MMRPPAEIRRKPPLTAGFTLIELSVVLVIIGLIVGGVLVGQSLVNAAALRATVSQIEKFNTAANTFYTKYGYLPGDIPDPLATDMGFQPRGSATGQGDGNGILMNGTGGWRYGYCQGEGEVMMFWVDLSTAGLIEGNFSTARSAYGSGLQYVTTSSTPSLYNYYPVAKTGNSGFIYVWSGGANGAVTNDGNNYLGLTAIPYIYNSYSIGSAPGLTVAQAYAMDTKIDDSLPTSGRVMAMGISPGNGQPAWLGSSATAYQYGGPNPGTAASGTSASCYDNGGSASTAMYYSMEQNGGAGLNCSLSFLMQGAANAAR